MPCVRTILRHLSQWHSIHPVHRQVYLCIPRGALHFQSSVSALLLLCRYTPIKPKYPKSAENAANFPACAQCSRPVFLIESQFFAHHVGLISKHASQECRRGGRFQQSPLAGPCVRFGGEFSAKVAKLYLLTPGSLPLPKVPPLGVPPPFSSASLPHPLSQSTVNRQLFLHEKLPGCPGWAPWRGGRAPAS